MIYGYARVSSRGQAREGYSLEAQEKALRQAGAAEIFSDVFTGVVTDRPELDRLMSKLTAGDTFVVTKLDRIARNLTAGISLIDELGEKDVTVHVLDLGIIDNSPTGRLIRNVLLAVAEFDRDMIRQRLEEGKAISGNYGGRRKKFTQQQLQHAVELLNQHSYTQVAEMTGISKSTLKRAKKALNEGKELGA